LKQAEFDLKNIVWKCAFPQINEQDEVTHLESSFSALGFC